MQLNMQFNTVIKREGTGSRTCKIPTVQSMILTERGKLTTKLLTILLIQGLSIMHAMLKYELRFDLDRARSPKLLIKISNFLKAYSVFFF